MNVTNEITTQIEEISPERAANYLTFNRENRSLRMSRAKFLAEEMISGRFALTHQGIAFDLNGRLVDGQHRLRAVILAGVTVRMHVTRGLDPRVTENMDTMIPRTAADRLRLDQYSIRIATCYLKMATKRTKVHDEAILQFLGTFQGDINELPVVRTGRKRSKTPILAAAAIRIHQFRGTAAFDQTFELMRAYFAGDLVGARPVTISLYKQVHEGVNSNSFDGTWAIDRQWFARGWVAFDPDSAGTPRIQIRDPNNQIAEAVEVVGDALSKAGDAGANQGEQEQ